MQRCTSSAGLQPACLPRAKRGLRRQGVEEQRAIADDQQVRLPVGKQFIPRQSFSYRGVLTVVDLRGLSF